MMRTSILNHVLPLGVLLTFFQIKTAVSAPLGTPKVVEASYDCDSASTTASVAIEPTRTVLESSDGHVFVPYTTLTNSVLYTTNSITTYSITVVTSYDSLTYTTTETNTQTSSVAPVLSTKEPDTSSYTLLLSTELTSLSSSAVQTPSTSVIAQTSVPIATSLETAGRTSAQPFATSIATASTPLSLVNTPSTSIAESTMPTSAVTQSVNNIFVAISGDAPPSQISQRSDHPVTRLGIANQSKKLSTNKFYANFFLGSQASTSFTHPYSVAWSKGSGGTSSWGLSISHIERSQLAYGSGSPAPYFINPIGIQSIILSANELNTSTVLTTDSHDAFSVNVNLLSSAGKAAVITFPLCQGMGYVTGVYSAATPRIESSVAFASITYIGLVSSGSTYKYRAVLADGTTWLLYVTTSQSGYPVNAFTMTTPRLIQGAAGFNGFIQVAKVQSGKQDAESLYDASAGTYPVSASISGSTSGTSGTYSLSWAKQGVTSRTLLMYALPHHIEVLSRSSVNVTDMQLQTTTKGIATAIVGDSWTLVEPDLPVDMGFAPWSPSLGSVSSVSTAAAQLIAKAGESELSQDMHAQSYLDSMYYSGKALAKFAAIIYSVHDIVGNQTLAATGLQKLETAFAAFVNNSQVYPLIYESAWGGVVSSGTYKTGDSGLDFGNTYYNDHHFHYGYFVYAAAVIGYLDPGWLNKGTNKAWVNLLVRDYANSVSGTYFPFSRSFDWFHGHSWAKGLFESGDGKDQESTSEDAMASYAIKMWGRTVNDKAMEARGNLMLSIQARSFQHYFLYTSDNTVQPASFIGNKVSGILFENKIDHTTYFGSNTEYIEGIHMLPLMPFSTLTRTKEFVTEEWNKYFSSGRADSVAGGWRGVLYANLAIIDALTSFNWFSSPTFDTSLLDGGASLTWYLTFSAALGGSPATSAQKRTAQAMPERVAESPTAAQQGKAVSNAEVAEERKETARERKEAAAQEKDEAAKEEREAAAEEKREATGEKQEMTMEKREATEEKKDHTISNFFRRLAEKAEKRGM